MRAISQSLAPVREHRLRPSSLVLVLQAVTNWIVYSQHAAGKEIPAIFESIAKQLEDKSHTLHSPNFRRGKQVRSAFV